MVTLESLKSGLGPVWTMVPDILANAGIAFAYVWISYSLFIFVRKRNDFQHGWILNFLSWSVLVCGLSHMLLVINLFVQISSIAEGGLVITAFSALLAASLLWQALPGLLSLPSTVELKATRDSLEREVTARRISEERIVKIFDSAYDGICIFNQDSQYTHWNKAAENIYGWTKEDVVGKYLGEIDGVDPVRIKFYKDEVQRYMDTGDSTIVNQRRELKTVGKNGKSRHIEMYVLGIQEPDNKWIFATFSKDIQERMRLEDLAAKRTMELESFSYTVSHDLRSPLRTINGYTYMLASQFAEDLPEKAKLYLDLIQAKSEFMGKLIDDLLSFSRLGRQGIKQQRLDMSQLVKTVWDEVLGQEASMPSAAKEMEITIHDVPFVNGDATLVTQVIINLLSNAIKYSKSNEPLKIEFGHDGFAFYIKDNGIGFSMQHATKLFAVFQRLHSTQLQYEGTGVGLAIVKKIIEKHNGTIWAESKPNEGATFFFTLGATS